VKQWQIERVHKIFKYHEFDDILAEYSAIISENGSPEGTKTEE
jgi:hypothetical protein